jgi:hypothetical protein
MTELQSGKVATPKMVDLDDAELLGFEWLDAELGGEAKAEQTIGVAFNKIGLSGEGPTIK